MNVRSQIATVFHLDKCIGCHTCSVACKNIWTDRRGAETMWWNNVETRPGTGYPTRWEDQDKFKGGWAVAGQGQARKLRLRLQDRVQALGNIFYNPALPGMDEYYEPWTYRYDDLFTAPQGDDQPTARPVSLVDGRPMEVEAGPNWDDDLGGSSVYAANDPLLEGLSESERQQLFDIGRLVYFYVPRICNHCLNPACLAACPSGAIYKRAEDGIVLVNQEKCRAWRMCISACPYKKVYYNWAAGKSEKCILCYPRQETGQAPACFHACVGRIRYLGVLLYDADRLEEAALAPDAGLVEAQRAAFLNPADPEVIAAAQRVRRARGRDRRGAALSRLSLRLRVADGAATAPGVSDAADALLRASAFARDGRDPGQRHRYAGRGVLQLAGTCAVAQPLHGPAAGRGQRRAGPGRLQEADGGAPLQTRRRRSAISLTHRWRRCSPRPDWTRETAEAIYRLTALSTHQERFVIPPMAREQAIEATENPMARKQQAGFGFRKPGRRGP